MSDSKTKKASKTTAPKATSPAFSQEAIRQHMRAHGFPDPEPEAEPVDYPRLEAWALAQGYSWDADHKLPEPICGGCGLPINVWDGEDACPDCDDCDSCCWDNHGGEPHSVMAQRYETDLPEHAPLCDHGCSPEDDEPCDDGCLFRVASGEARPGASDAGAGRCPPCADRAESGGA